METRVPFAGFYESFFDKALDDEQEQYVDHLAEEHGIKAFEINELIWKHHFLNHNVAQNHVCIDYVPEFQSYINDNLDLKIELTYKEMTSPREYNFETDKIWAEISYPDALRLARRVGRKALRKAAKAMFTSRDGFISFYRSDITEWGPLRTWDHNQLYCLMQAAADSIDPDNYDWLFVESMGEGGTLSTAFDKAFDHSGFMFELGKLVGRKELEEENADEDDGMRFPVSFEDTKDYVEKYQQLNSKEI